MDFGKLADISRVDFTMPDDPLGTTRLLQSLHGSGRVLIGVSAWAEKAYCSHFYPGTAKPSTYLQHYAQQFDTVELNATHYGIPSERQLEQWSAQVTDRFRFCPKIPQVISHRADLGLRSGHLANYLDVIGALGKHLGLQFLQLPPEFGADKAPLLEQFLKIWPKEFPLAVEFRHPSWFVEESVWPMLAQYNIGTVITDVAGRRDVLHMQITAPFVMVRFVGNSLHTSDFTRLDDWTARVQKWQSAGVRVYFMPHQPQPRELIEMSFEVAARFHSAGIVVSPLKRVVSVSQGELF